MPTYVTPDELQRIKALSAMAKAFPDDADDIKAKKKDWWATTRDKYGLGDEDKYKIGLDTGEIRLKSGGSTDVPPPAPKWVRMHPDTVVQLLNDAAFDAAYDTSVDAPPAEATVAFNGLAIDDGHVYVRQAA